MDEEFNFTDSSEAGCYVSSFEEDDEPVIKEIEDVRVVEDHLEFLTRWRGINEPTWVPLSGFRDGLEDQAIFIFEDDYPEKWVIAEEFLARQREQNEQNEQNQQNQQNA